MVSGWRTRPFGTPSAIAHFQLRNRMRWDMAGKREEIDTGTDKRYVRRDDEGQFNELDDQSRSLSQDHRRDAENESEKGQGDEGDSRT
jgi:hypothetical protein